MRRAISVAIATLALLFSSNAFSQIQDPVKWKVSTQKVDETKYEVIFDATIDMGWHLYSSENPPGGPIPTTFIFTESENYSAVGNPKPIGDAKVEHDEIFEMDVAYFDNKAQFVQTIELNEGIEGAKVSGEIEYQACFEDKCIFLTYDFSTTVGEVKPIPLPLKLKKRISKPILIHRL